MINRLSLISVIFSLALPIMAPGVADAVQPKIAAGQSHTVLVRSDGTLWAWGDNRQGQLGDGTNVSKSSPVQIAPDSSFIAAGAGTSHTAAIKTDGTLWLWGSNSYGQLGDGTSVSKSSPVQIASGSTFSAVAAGAAHTIAVKSDGTLWSWGFNYYGQLGDGTTTDRYEPVQIAPGSTFIAVAAGGYYTMAIKSDGTLWAWGANWYGELGDGTTTEKYEPVQIAPGSTFIAVAATDNHTLAIRNDGTLWAWGWNAYGQIGDGTTTDRPEPVQIAPGSAFTAVAAGYFHTAAIKSDGTLWAWGWNRHGQLGNGTNTDQLYPVQVASNLDFTAIAAGSEHTIAIKSDGTLWAWGSNLYGELGNGPSGEKYSPVQVITGISITAIAAGSSHAIAIDSAGELWGWGYNARGQLGDGTTAGKASPVRVAAGNTFMAVSAANVHTAAINTDGTLWTWGDNSYGQLGDGTTTQRNSPVQIASGNTFTAVAAGAGHTAAIRSDGTLWVWGKNIYGQIGDGTTTQRNSPVQVAVGSTFMAVAAGDDHTLAIRTDGTLWAWGLNNAGQLGDGTTTQRNIPVQIAAGSTFIDVSGGGLHTVAIKSDGTLWAWGYNFYGQLGDGTQWQRNSPVQIAAGSTFSTVAAGYYFTAAIRNDDKLWAWGQNRYGQLGDGTTTQRNSPIEAAAGSTFSAVAAGSGFAAAIKSDGTLWTWGSNWNGQLGDGSAWKETPEFITTVDPFPVTPSARPGGSISPSTVQYVNFNGTTSFSITPEPGYNIETVTGCNGALAGNTYTTGPITAACTVSATFALIPPTWPLTVSVVGSGTVHTWPGTDLACRSNCGTTFNEGSQVTLQAEPDADSMFVGWGGACSGIDPVCTVTMSGAIDVTATFAIVDTDGDGVADIYDNCPAVANADQTSTNGFGFGDACTAIHCVNNSAELQAALTSAQNNGLYDVLQLMQGVYGISANGNARFSYNSSEGYGVAIEGGYAAGCSFKVLDANTTVLDGENITPGGSGAGVLDLRVNGYETATFVLRGVTIRNGRSDWGGGLYAYVNVGTLSVENNVFRNNAASLRGGAMYLTSDHMATVSIRSNFVQDNSAGNAYAGIHALSPRGNVALINNVITGNILTNNTSIGGAGVKTDYGRIDVINNTIANNRVLLPDGYGAGLYVEMSYAGSTGNIYNNIFWGNEGITYPDLAVNNWNSTVNIFSNDVDPAKMTSGSALMGNNLNVDPLFVSPATGDYHLTAGSLLFNAGSNDAPNLPAFDIAGNTRTNEGIADMGAYEFVGQTLTVSLSGNGSGTVTSIPSGIDCGSTCTSTFNNGTIISLTPTPHAGNSFTGWSGDCSGTSSCQVTMSMARNVTAAFAPSTWTFAVTVTGPGTVHTAPGADLTCRSNCGQSYVEGTVVTLTAMPDPGYHIVSLSGCGGVLEGNVYTTAPITADCTVSATFAINTYTVTPTAGSNGSVSPSTPQMVNYNETASFTVTPDIGYHIALVSGCSGTLNGNTYTTGPMTGDCSVSATFAINSYTVIPTAGANGSISPSTPQTVNYNQTGSFTVTPDIGYHIALVTGCSGTLNGNTYTTGPVAADCTVSATFAINTYTVTPTAGPNGSVSPAIPQSVNYNQTASFTITPDTGYHIALVSGCTGTLNGNTYITGPVTADCTVSATFAINTYTVTPTAGSNGSVSPSTPQTVNYNETASFTVTPETGYHIALVTGCTGTLNGNTYITGPVAADCTVSATFAINTYTVTPTAGPNGSISPATPQTVNHNQPLAFTITPDIGYHIDTVTGCSGTLNGNTYTTGPVTADCTVSATFAINTYTVTPTAGANGSISPSIPRTVNYNQTASFTVTPETGYHIALVSGCSGTLNGNTYTTGPVTSDCTVSATFAINTYTVTPSAGANGGISPSIPQTVNYNQATSFTITPDTGYHIALVSGCSGTLNGNTYTTGEVTSDCAVSATFAINIYTVTPSAGANGSISPAIPQTVNYNQSLAFTITPDIGFHIDTVTGCSGTLNGNTYTTGPTTADCPVSATFAMNIYTLTVTKAGTGSGTVTSAPAGINCGGACSASFTHGTEVTLTASSGSDSTFAGWSGGNCYGTGYCVTTMGSAKNVIATFTKIINVTTPNGGEVWSRGGTYTIEWNYLGGGLRVKIELLKGGVVDRTIANNAPTGSNGIGTYDWKIPSNLATGTDYSVRITSNSNIYYIDTSDANFTIQ